MTDSKNRPREEPLGVAAPPGQGQSFALGRVVLLIAILMILVEFMIMLVLSWISIGITGWRLALFDALLLSVVVAPLTYWGLIRPQERKLSRALEDLEQARALAEEQARIDSLTGVLSRRAIF